MTRDVGAVARIHMHIDANRAVRSVIRRDLDPAGLCPRGVSDLLRDPERKALIGLHVFQGDTKLHSKEALEAGHAVQLPARTTAWRGWR